MKLREPLFEIGPQGMAEQPTACNLETIYQRYYQRVFQICLRMISNRADAEDLTQDVFVQVQRHWQTFRGEATISAWLYRIAVNQVYMHWRKRVVRYEVVTAQGALPEDAQPVTAKLGTQRNSDYIALINAIRQLPTGMRTVLVLHDIYGYDHDEIGRLLGVHSGTSKSQLHKARAKVRELLHS
ncbi:MAG: RNA polymerase sigma factor [Acidobacteriota bacterium]